MSTHGALTSSSSSSSTPQWTYDIFLSFRGETRKNFTDHLYDALERKGIWTFRDDEKLERGNTISKELLKAIEKSRFAIVIFSKNYASSKWCLDELVHIVRCKNETGLKVMPVFYHVNPSVVRKQRGTFAQAFKEHKKRFGRSFLERLNKCKSKKMKKWRSALREVANISGWNLQDRKEAEFIREIVGEMEKLCSKISSTTKNLVGIESSVQKLKSSYFGFKNNVGMIGIYGIGGLGKTTLARLVYDNFRSHFEGSSFIANVREGSKNPGLHKLQQQLLANILEDKNIDINNVYDGVNMISKRLCCKKVLLVIDDVDQLDQLKNLAGDHSWFGKGSCVIITTRDERVLIQHGVLERYKPNVLDSDDASKLFCLNAFKNEQPKEGYMKLSQEVVEYANGLPLAIVTLGSFFVGRTIEEWQHALDGFKKTERKIFDVLKISYDGLGAQYLKDIFLDIACFFRGELNHYVIQILQNCGFNASYGISVLMEKSLLTMDDNGVLGMHDLLQEMGEQIIRQESGENLGKQSRLWLVKDLLYVLENNMATEAIQAIVLQFEEIVFKVEDVPELLSSKMSNLRLMIIEEEDFLDDEGAVLNNQRQLFVPNQLRHLRWDYCPLKCLSSSSQPKELVQLDLKYSRIEYLWEGVMRSDNLKSINLHNSQNLIRTPDFSGVPMLEELDLSWCVSLVEIHPSIGQLSKLEELNLFRCVSLVEIHPSIGQLSKLRFLNLERCESLTDLPYMSTVMQSLAKLSLLNCPKISSFPKFTGIMKSLSTLYLHGTAIEKIPPSSIKCLPALTFLVLEGTNLKSLPRLPSTVRCINVKRCNSLKWLPARVKLSIWSQPLSQWVPYDERHSRKEFTILFHFLQGLLCRKPVYGTSSKGKEDGSITEFQIIMPSCLTKIVKNSISIELPSNWYNSKWIGLALWASVSTPSNAYAFTYRVVAIGKMSQNHCAFERFTTRINVEVKTETHDNYILYLSRDKWFATVGNGECSQIKVKFKGGKLYDTKIGVSLVYEKDVDEFNQTNAQCLIESFGEVGIYKLTVGDDDGDDDEDDDEDDDGDAGKDDDEDGDWDDDWDDDDDDDDENDDEDDDGDADKDDDEDGDWDDDWDDDDEDGDWDDDGDDDEDELY